MANDGDRVTVHYHGTLEDGEVFDSSRGGEPFSFVVGAGDVIAGFDTAVRGLGVGENVTVTLPPDEAYGEHTEELIFEVPKAEAPEGIAAGDQVQLGNGAPAVIVEVTEEVVRVDANHPLAGEALTFEIEIVGIQ